MADGESLLPELARSLRTLGAARGAAAEAAHAAVFAPLIGARARATRADAVGAVAALAGAPLTKRIASLSGDAAQAGQSDPARARARLALAREILEPLQDALSVLDTLGEAVTSSATPAWEEWLAQLRHVFVAADVACGRLARLLADRDEPADRRWFGGAGTGR